MPSVIPATDFLTGRGFLDSRQALGSTTIPLGAAAPEEGRSFFSRLPEELRFPVGSALQGSELVATLALVVADQRDFDRLLSQLDHSDPGGTGETGGTGGTGGTETDGSDGGTEPPEAKTRTFTNLPDCSPSFFLDIFIPPDAQEPITHEFIGPEPCPSAIYIVEKFPAGEKPPGTADGELRWQNHKTYRINVNGAGEKANDVTIKVSWKNP